MTHKRKDLRNTFKALMDAEFGDISVDMNRVHRVSAFPAINIMNGNDEGTVEDYTADSEPRRLTIKIDIYVASANHDDDIDDILERIEENVVKLNRNSLYWSYCYFERAEEPESVAGKTNYSVAPVEIVFMYEV